MALEIIEIENLKCGGCANSIKNGLKKIAGIETVKVDLEKSEVIVEHTEGVTRATLTQSLLKMGYPEKGSVEGLASVAASAKSFVSCAIGRLS